MSGAARGRCNRYCPTNHRRIPLPHKQQHLSKPPKDQSLCTKKGLPTHFLSRKSLFQGFFSPFYSKRSINFKISYFLLITAFALSAILAAVNPYFSNSSSGKPDSPKLSSTPTRAIGTGQCSTKTSATALPNPP